MQFSSHTKWPNRWSGGHEGRFSRNSIAVLSAEDPCEQFCHGQGCPLFGVVHLAFPLRSRRCPPSNVAWRIVLERQSWSVPCPNQARFPLLTPTDVASDSEIYRRFCDSFEDFFFFFFLMFVASTSYFVSIPISASQIVSETLSKTDSVTFLLLYYDQLHYRKTRDC